MSNTKFKSGEKVVFCKSSLESGMIDAKEGDVFTIKECLGPGCRVASLKELPGHYHKSHFEHYVEKEKVVEKYIPNVGDKVKGFKFDDDSYSAIGYVESMDDFVGKQGTVHCVIEDRFSIDFGDNCWAYPLELAHLAKIEEPSQEISHEDSKIDWQVGQVVWDVVYGKGEVVNVLQNILRYPVVVKFVDGKRHFTEDGKTDEEFARTSFFSEPKIIAETKPPKKPFVPVFKKDDIAVAYNGSKDSAVFSVYQEQEDFVQSKDGECYEKCDWKFYKLGEQIKFS